MWGFVSLSQGPCLLLGVLSRPTTSGNGRDDGDRAREQMETWPQVLVMDRRTGVKAVPFGAPVSLDFLGVISAIPV